MSLCGDRGLLDAGIVQLCAVFGLSGREVILGGLMSAFIPLWGSSAEEDAHSMESLGVGYAERGRATW
jgi:hypothetical protein